MMWFQYSMFALAAYGVYLAKRRRNWNGWTFATFLLLAESLVALSYQFGLFLGKA